MLVKLPKYDFSDVKIIFDSAQKDYDVFENESTIIFVYGYPYSTESDNWISAIDIYNFYTTRKLDFVHLIDGFYSIMIIDKIQNISFFIVDRYGIYSLFYYKCKRFILVSDNIKTLIKHLAKVELNEQSIIEYLNFGYKLGDKTHIKGVYELEAAKKYVIDIDLIVKKYTYWNLLGLTESSKISKAEFREIFNKYHGKILNLGKKICLPFTGGRNTRAILSSYINNIENINIYTHGPKYHSDVKFAQKVSSEFNIPHSFYKLNGKWFKNIVHKTSLFSNEQTFNGLNSFFDYIHVVESLQNEQKKAEVFVSGVLANQLYCNHPFGNSVPDSASISNISEFIVKNMPSAFNFKTNLSSYYKNVFKDLSIDKVNEKIQKNIEKELLKSVGAVNALDYLQYFLFSSYSANMASNSLKLTGKYFKVIGSFFHKDLLQQIRFMSLSDRTNATVQKFIIKQNSFYLSKFRYYNSTTVVKYLKLIGNKFWNKIFNKNLFHNPNVVNYPYWLRKYHKNFLLEILNYDNMKLKTLFNEKELNKLVQQFIENKTSFRNKKAILVNFSLDKFMINLISLELWLKDIKLFEKDA